MRAMQEFHKQNPGSFSHAKNAVKGGALGDAPSTEPDDPTPQFNAADKTALLGPNGSQEEIAL